MNKKIKVKKSIETLKLIGKIFSYKEKEKNLDHDIKLKKFKKIIKKDRKRKKIKTKILENINIPIIFATTKQNFF